MIRGLIVTLVALPAHAELYQRVDVFGHVTLTNIAPRGTQPETPRRTAPPASRLVIPAEAQKARDAKRRAILETELQYEQQQAEKADGPARELHAQNIAALQQELKTTR